jgi:hypothetical protein
MIARVSAAGASLTVLSSSGGATFSLAPALTSFVRGFRRQFLVGLAEDPPSKDAKPRRFRSFARFGTGSSPDPRRSPPPPPSRTKWTLRVPRPVLSGHAASLTPY